MGERKYLPNSTGCFVCGLDNPAGLRMRFYVEDDIVKTPMRVHEHHVGYPNTVHGGIVAAALDECMAWAATRALSRMCVTAELTVRYVKRIPLDTELTVNASVVRAHRLLVYANGEIVDAEGGVFVRAEGKFTPLTDEETLTVDDGLVYRGGEERIFDGLRGEAAKAEV